MEFWYLEVFRVVDSEFGLEIQKFKMTDPTWRMKSENLLNSQSDGAFYSRIFGVPDYEFELKIQKFEKADPIWRMKSKNLFDLNGSW